MPTVPRRTEQEVLPAIPDIAGPARPPAAAFGASQQTRQQTGLVRDIVGTAVKISREEQKRIEDERVKAKEDADRMLVLDADLQAAELQNDLDLQVRELKGRNSIGAMDLINKEWEKGLKNIDSTLTNQGQRDAFNISAGKRFLSLKKNTGIHMNTQFDQYAEGLRKSSMKTAQEQAAINYTDLEFVADQFQRQEAIINAFAERDGKGKEWRGNEIAKARSRTHSEIIKRMLLDNEVGLADEYEKRAGGEIRSDDISSILKLRTEQERLKVSASDEFQRQIWLEASMDNVSNERVDDFLRQGQITIPFHTKLKNFINKPYDKDGISDENKAGKYFEALDRYDELRGAKVDKKNNIVKRAKGNDYKTLQEFRGWMADNKEFFTRPQYRDIVDFTQQNYDESREAKIGIWTAFRQKLDALGMDRISMSYTLARAFGTIFSPTTSVSNAQETVDETTEAAVINANPNRTQYKIDQIITLPSGNWKVVGFADDGEPLVEEAQ